MQPAFFLLYLGLMTYTDGIHLIADSIPELHAFAKKIGLHRCWFHTSGNKKHYDLMLSPSGRNRMLNNALQAGTVYFKDKRCLIQIINHLETAGQLFA